jgi:hypothetical protein
MTTGRLGAVDILHDDVSEHQVEVVKLESFEGLTGSAGHLDGKSPALEGGGNHGPHGGLIVNNKNAHQLACGLFRAEGGRGARPPGFRQPQSQTPASVLVAHPSPLMNWIRRRQLRPAALNFTVTECEPRCNR